MRTRYALLGAPLLLLSFVALAQPKRAAKEPEDKAAKAAAAEKADKAEPKSEPAPAPGNDELGGPPPPKPASAREETKPSPLNPEANEFADGGAQAPPPEYDKLLGDIAALRSRVSALTTTLFASKLRVVVETRGSCVNILAMEKTNRLPA